MKLTDNIWKSPVILKRLYAESFFADSEKRQYWVVVPESGNPKGTIVLQNFQQSFLDIEPHEMQKMFANKLRQELQTQLHFDGVWMVGWTNPPSSGHAVMTDGDNCWGRLIAIWLDEDGDPQYTVETDLNFVQIIEAGINYYVGLAAQAHKSWSEAYGRKAAKEDFGIKESQMNKEVLSSLN